jgi:16S rRNA (cytosine967-C5)-methyltransferase
MALANHAQGWHEALMQTPSLTPRAYALAALAELFDQRRTLDEVLSAHNADEATYAQLRGLCMATLRHLGQIDALLKPYLQSPLPTKRQVARHALRLGVADLIVQGNAPHAVVHDMVEAVKHSPDKALAGLVNAVLKKVAADMPALPDCRFNLPGWLEQRWKAQYGKAVSDAICRVAAQRPPLDLNSVQPVKDATQLEPAIWRMQASHAPVPTLEGYAEGTFFVQDVAASYPVALLGEVAGKTVLDIGAAPGGKTAQLARAGANVVALDKSARRMERLQVNMQRLHLHVEVVVVDAAEYAPAEPFDIVVLDAPCSATGTWRRHPEVVHTVTYNDIAELAQQQRALLARAWGWVKPGGQLLYCVCSLEREEGEDQLEWFATQMPDAIALKQRRTTPAQMEAQGGMDGFFAMTWQKK